MVEATAGTPESDGSSTNTEPIKIADKDIIIFDSDSIPIEVMTDLLFEDLSSLEILNIARNDTVNGQNIIYSPIKNTTSLSLQYSPQNVLGLQNTSESYFNNFPIKFHNKIPNVGTGPNGEYVYVEPTTGNIIINVVNMDPDEQVEVQIMNTGSILNDTIYEAE
jgi:hypothetical protein